MKKASLVLTRREFVCLRNNLKSTKATVYALMTLLASPAKTSQRTEGATEKYGYPSKMTQVKSKNMSD